jgi:hypothetical protein
MLLTFRPTDITITCRQNDVWPIDFRPNDTASNSFVVKKREKRWKEILIACVTIQPIDATHTQTAEGVSKRALQAVAALAKAASTLIRRHICTSMYVKRGFGMSCHLGPKHDNFQFRLYLLFVIVHVTQVQKNRMWYSHYILSLSKIDWYNEEHKVNGKPQYSSPPHQGSLFCKNF